VSDLFDEMQRAVHRLGETMQVPINLPLDDDGNLDRKCPHNQCGASFKVMFDDWKVKVGDNVHCPICGCVRDSTEWHTLEQTAFIERESLAVLQERVNTALAHAVRQTTSVTYGGLVRMALSFRPEAPIVTIPIEAARAMQLKCVCDKCGCRYAAVGFAFFCPACGYESVVIRIGAMFDGVRKAIHVLEQTRAHMTAAVGEDVARDMIRSIREDKIVSMVGLFQHFAECLYKSFPSAGAQPPKNVFQRLNDGSERWATRTGNGFGSMLQSAEYQRLKLHFQRRHLFAHRHGVVDQEYISKSGDTSFSIGQRLVVTDADVLDMCDILSRLCKGMQASAAAGAPVLSSPPFP